MIAQTIGHDWSMTDMTTMPITADIKNNKWYGWLIIRISWGYDCAVQ